VLAVGVGVALTEETTPLFHCNFLPTFTHVNFLPEEIDVCPALVQVDPALTAEKLASAFRIENPIDKQDAMISILRFFSFILEE
jgi:hypothetical protein